MLTSHGHPVCQAKIKRHYGKPSRTKRAEARKAIEAQKAKALEKAFKELKENG